MTSNPRNVNIDNNNTSNNINTNKSLPIPDIPSLVKLPVQPRDIKAAASLSIIKPQYEVLSSIIDIEHRDHKSIFDLYDLYKKCDPTHLTGKFQYVKTIIRLFSQHTFLEEIILFPSLPRLIPNGGEKMYKDSLQEHKVLKDLFSELDNLNITDASMDNKLSIAMEEFKKHSIDHEEKDILLKLESSASLEELFAIGKEFEEKRNSAPTKPHPWIPTNPTAEKVIGTILKPFDQLKEKMETVETGIKLS
jgi:hypothetical protein